MKQICVKDIHKPSGKLEIFLFNVGQGDHLMLKFPNGEYGIIDFYYDSGEGKKIPEPPCISYFRELKENLSAAEFEKVTISFFCFSHMDKDHVKGITEAIDWFDREGLYIDDIWLAGARDKSQFDDFFGKKLPELFKKHFAFDEQADLLDTVNLFDQNHRTFFDYFKKWSQGKFKSKRYKDLSENRGKGEYLVEAKSLPKPSANCSAFNIGPRNTQLDDYFENSNLDILKRIFKIKDRKNPVDKNLISHILKIRFGEVNTLFGGDTHKKIWEECLDYYDNPRNELVEKFGNYDSHFIKVSHHGSKNSSSPTVWKRIIPESKKNYLGISAGQHSGYKHPHSETLKDIREIKNDSNILSTNVCVGCLEIMGFEMEHHQWYEDFLTKNASYRKKSLNKTDFEIDGNFSRHTLEETSETSEIKQKGLFAYIFEIPNNLKEEINVRIALSNFNRSYDCFFKDHQEKLRDCCG